MSSETRKTNYDKLDKILADANIPARQGRSKWVPSETHPDGGYMVYSQEEFEQLVKSNDAIERYLRS